MCKIDCSGGCRDCDPESHTVWIVTQFDCIRAVFETEQQASDYIDSIRQDNVVYGMHPFLINKEL